MAGARADNAQYYYDPAGRLTAMVDPVNGSAQYNYDAVGNILSVVRQPITAVMVAQVSPSRGPVGAVVTIFGTGFDTTADTTVSFNGQAAAPITVSATQITVAVPTGAASGPVSVTSAAGTASSVANFTVTTNTAPTITSVSPSPADQGTTITISGSGFDPLLANDKAGVNGRYAGVASVSPTTVTATVPSATSGYVSVMTPNGTATSGSYLVVPPLPYLASSIGSVVKASIGSSATSSVASAAQIGLILFDATAGQRLSMQVTASSFGGASLGLYGPDGVAIVPLTAISAGTFFATQVLPRAGTYTVLIAPWTQAGSATVNLINVPPDVTATIAANGTAVSLTTTVPGQNGSLTFSGTAGQMVSLLMQPNNICVYLTVTAPDGTTQLYTANPCGSQFSGALVLPQTGTYTIAVDPDQGQTGTATFTLYTVPPNVTATIAANGMAVSLTTTVPGQNGSLTFSGMAGQTVSLATQTNNLCVYFTITAPDGTTQLYTANPCSSDFSGVLVLPQTGTYTIAVYPDQGQTGTATYTLYTVPPNVTATIAANGTAVSLTTTVPGQNGTLTFAGTAGQPVSLQTQPNNLCTYLTITAPDGTTQLYTANPCGSDFSGVLILPTTGNYTIAVYPNHGEIGTTTFTLNTVPLNVSATIAANGTAVSLATTVPGTNISLTFSGTAGQRVSLLSQTAFCFVVTVTAPDGTTQLYQRFNCDSDFSGVLVLPTTGTYTIFFSVTPGQVGNGSFTLYNEPANASATITPGGGSVGLTTTVPGQSMDMTFSGTVGQRVSLLTQPNWGCASLTVMNPNGTTLYTNWVCNTDYSGVLVLPTTGTYSIVVNLAGTEIGAGTYTLYNIPANVSGSINIGDPASSYTTTVPSQAIQVSFTGAAGQSATVNVAVVSATPSSPCYLITTLEPDGVTVLRGDQSCNSGYSSGSLSLPQSGTYTVVVAPSNVAIGTFSVGVTTP